MLSTDLTSWIKVYDSSSDGTYVETTLGHMINMLPDKEVEFDNTARFVRWTISENNKNARNVFCELMAFTNTNGTLENVALNKKIWKNWN